MKTLMREMKIRESHPDKNHTLRSVVTVFFDLANAGIQATRESTRPIQVNFQPEEVVVRSVCFSNAAGAANILLVQSDLVDGVLCSTPVGLNSHAPNSTFQLEKQVKGTFRFRFTSDDLLTAPPTTGKLSVTLEFLGKVIQNY